MKFIWNKISNPFKKIKPKHAADEDYLEQYAMITLPNSVLEFDHKSSVALCVGIDKQLHSEYAHRSLGETVAKDAESIGEALITSLGLNVDQVKVCISSAQPYDCTKMGLNALFVESAKKAKENGIFIFYFAGHGCLVTNGHGNPDGDRCILVPADFSGKKEDLNIGISGDDLLEWLHAAECKANHVLIIFDCCFAGNLGTTLTSIDNALKIKPSLSVMCGCAAKEKCLSFTALRHSIFAYFLLHYLKSHHCVGQFEVKQAMEDIAELCFSFSSLFVSYNHDTEELQPGKMNPMLLCRTSIDEPDCSRFESLVQLFERGRPKPVPHEEVDKWLNSLIVQKSLEILHLKVSFSETMQDGIFYAMLYSAASIQYRHDKTSLENKNLFIVIAINVLGAIGCVYPEVNVTVSHLILGLEYYKLPIQRAKLAGEMKFNMKFLDDLCSNMITIESSTCTKNEGSGDEVDGLVLQTNMLNKV